MLSSTVLRYSARSEPRSLDTLGSGSLYPQPMGVRERINVSGARFPREEWRRSPTLNWGNLKVDVRRAEFGRVLNLVKEIKKRGNSHLAGPF